MIPIMRQAIVFGVLTLAGVALATLSDNSCPENEIFRPTGGPGCENCGPRCLVFNTTAKCYCKSGYSRVNGNCIPNEKCPLPKITRRTAMENPNLYEGDILGIPIDGDRSAVPRDTQLWPGGVIPYVIDDALPRDQRNVTLWAMGYIQNTTCIRFVRRTVEWDYIRIIYGVGCSSDWGRTGGQQTLSMGPRCEYTETALHELMHAMGFAHEHKRSDRDDYIIIYWNNIQPNMTFNFRKLAPYENRLLTPFDYDSIMLYNSIAFAMSGLSMVKKDGSYIYGDSYRSSMSPIDIRRVKLLYRCPN